MCAINLKGDSSGSYYSNNSNNNAGLGQQQQQNSPSSSFSSLLSSSISLILIATAANATVFNELREGREQFESELMKTDIPQRLTLAIESQAAYLSTYAIPEYCIHFVYIVRLPLLYGESSSSNGGSNKNGGSNNSLESMSGSGKGGSNKERTEAPVDRKSIV